MSHVRCPQHVATCRRETCFSLGQVARAQRGLGQDLRETILALHRATPASCACSHPVAQDVPARTRTVRARDIHAHTHDAHARSLEHTGHGHADTGHGHAGACARREHTRPTAAHPGTSTPKRTDQLGEPGANPAHSPARPRARAPRTASTGAGPPAAAARRPALPHRGTLRRPPARPARGAMDRTDLLQCAAGRPRTAKPSCPSDAAPRRARDRRTAHRRRLQPRRGPAAPSPSISSPGARAAAIIRPEGVDRQVGATAAPPFTCTRTAASKPSPWARSGRTSA